MLVKGINDAFPTTSFKSRNRRRIENAYTDSMRFYTFTNHRDSRLLKRALEIDRSEGYRHRRSAVFHFAEAGAELDPANLRRQPWPHPCDPTVVSERSYLDLMAEAQRDVVPKLRRLLSLIGWPGSAAERPAADAVTGPAGAAGWFAELAALFGDQSLGATLRGDSCAPVHCEPLPLPELFERLHHEPEAPPPAHPNRHGRVVTEQRELPATGLVAGRPMSDAATRGFVHGTARDRGFEQVARFLLLIGAERSAPVLARLTEREVVCIAREVAALGSIEPREQRRTWRSSATPCRPAPQPPVAEPRPRTACCRPRLPSSGPRRCCRQRCTLPTARHR